MTHRDMIDFDARRTGFAADKARKAANLRRAWADVAEDALTLTRRLIETDGAEAVESIHLLAKLRAVQEAGGDSFPVQGASAAKVAMGFAQSLRGLLEASLPRYRAIMAPAVAAGAQAVRDLIAEHLTLQAATWRGRTGEEA